MDKRHWHSMPGVIVPWERLVTLFRSQDIISLVDAAHQIGQLPINLRSSAPDFWLSNCHKWLLAHRAVAVLYVAKQWQRVVHSLPVGNAYTSLREKNAKEGNRAWTDEFIVRSSLLLIFHVLVFAVRQQCSPIDSSFSFFAAQWNGTVDWSPLLSVNAALDFRLACGGEERITAYCHDLAVQGGASVARILGTEVMRNEEGEGELIANMVRPFSLTLSLFHFYTFDAL